jgi:GH15 family glucan-1,4-alpha-glucosidase
VARSLILSNGRLFLAYDERYRLRELTWPLVGFPNHLLGHPCRLGVWRDGHFAWTDDHAWHITFEKNTTLRHEKLALELVVEEGVATDRNLHFRRIQATDLSGARTPVRLFVHYAPAIEECDHGNTAFYWPDRDAIVHYRGFTYLAAGGKSNAGGLKGYACGITRFGDREGTWRDAEDGELSGDTIAQGSVDSVYRLDLDLSSGTAWAETYLAVAEQLGIVPPFSPAEISGAPPTDLEVLQAHASQSGAIVAAIDSDIMATNKAHYAYCWPRDAAHIADVAARAGDSTLRTNFLRFAETLERRNGAYLQKYRPDWAAGASWHPQTLHGERVLPVQTDETAAVLDLACSHGEPPAWTQELAEFLVAYTEEGLPKPSWDLWEERRGVHAYTVAGTITALGKAARAFGEPRYAEHAAAMQSAWREQATNTETGVAYRSLLATPVGLVPDVTPDASVLAAELLMGDHATLRKTREYVIEHLEVRSPVGGIARNGHDYYFRQSDAYPGNPWIITTMWVAQADIRLGDLESAQQRLDWVERHSSPAGLLPEQLHPETGAPLSVQPLPWSHAERLRTTLDLRDAR